VGDHPTEPRRVAESHREVRNRVRARPPRTVDAMAYLSGSRYRCPWITPQLPVERGRAGSGPTLAVRLLPSQPVGFGKL
jgi:hypothetical protein